MKRKRDKYYLELAIGAILKAILNLHNAANYLSTAGQMQFVSNRITKTISGLNNRITEIRLSFNDGE